MGLVAGLILAGCAASPSGRAAALPSTEHVRTVGRLYRGDDGTCLTWSQLMDDVAESDVIIIGETHDDATGHRVQLAIVEDVLDRWPQSALSMEMLDRSEQAVVDDYLRGFIDRESFFERTAQTRWRKISQEYLEGSINKKTFRQRISRIGWPDWEGNYQPVIDAAKTARAPVVAANTPWLVYTSVARKEGFEGLDDVTPAQRALFEVPDGLPEGRYRERFWEAIAGRPEGEPPPEDGDASESADAHAALTDEQILGLFRGQLVMDATMAGSIVSAHDAGAAKVVHLVGHFHCDFEGGLVEELRRRRPEARVLVISLLDVDEAELRDQDIGRADVVVYTGAISLQ